MVQLEKVYTNIEDGKTIRDLPIIKGVDLYAYANSPNIDVYRNPIAKIGTKINEEKKYFIHGRCFCEIEGEKGKYVVITKNNFAIDAELINENFYNYMMNRKVINEDDYCYMAMMLFCFICCLAISIYCIMANIMLTLIYIFNIYFQDYINWELKYRYRFNDISYT